MKYETVQFLQLVFIFTDLVPKVLLDVLAHHIRLNKAFQKKFGKKPWYGECQKHTEWLATMMENSRVPKFSCEAVRKSEWDVTNLCAALLAVMKCSEVEVIVKVRKSRNDLYHRSKTEVSGDEFTQCVMSVRSLIEQALRPYFPKERSEGYLADLDKAKITEDFRRRCSDDRAVLELYGKASKELECVMKELEGVSELQQAMGQQRKKLLGKMELLKSELTGVVERLSCLEGKVDDLQHKQDTQSAAIKQLQIGQDSLLHERWQLTAPDTDLQPPPPKKPAHNPHVPDTELHPQAPLLKKCAYDEYRRFKLGEGPKAISEYVNLAVLEKPPSSKPEDVKDAMKAMKRFRDCGSRVAGDKASRVTPVDLLKKGSKRIRVVYGQAGSGKTTLLKQMCRALSCDGAESDFNLVLYFPLRERSVSSADDPQSLLKYYGRHDKRLDHAALAQEIVENSGKGLLLVFDGADEVKDLLKPSSGSVVQSFLEGRILHKAHIIISSRPGACPSLQDHSAAFYEVQGFDHAAITSYVKGFFEATPSAADSMLSQLETRPDLMGGAYIPMNTFILCTIFDLKYASFPATMTACYQAFVCQTIIQECRSKGRDLPLDPLLRYALLPEDIRCLLATLGTLAFRGLSHIPPMFVFNEYGRTRSEPSIRSTFPHELLPPNAPIDGYLFKGLLHMHASREGFVAQHSFSFSHGTQQEFFAALHLSTLKEDEQVQFWRENLFNTSFSVVLRFHAGLTSLCSPQVAKEVRSSLTGAAEGGSTSHSIGECSNDNPQLLLLFHALCESRNHSLTKEIMQHIPSSLEFRLSFSAFDTMAIAHCLSQCSHLRQLNLPYYSCTLLSPQCLSHLTEVLHNNPQCQLGDELNLSCDHFSAGDAQTLADIAVSLREVHLSVSHTECTALSTICSLPSVKKLVVIVRSDVKDDSRRALVESSLASNKQLEDLELNGCNAFLANMGKALTKNTSVRAFWLHREGPLPDYVACAIGTCVAAMTQLNTLAMCDLPLHVMKTLADRTQPLQYLYVYSPPGVNWDGFSKADWKEAVEAVATAKVREVRLWFNDKSTQRQRTVRALTAGLARSAFVRVIWLRCVPEEIRESVRQKLSTNRHVTDVNVSSGYF